MPCWPSAPAAETSTSSSTGSAAARAAARCSATLVRAARRRSRLRRGLLAEHHRDDRLAGAPRGAAYARSSGPSRPTTRPSFSTATRSPIPIASWSLWVMKMTARPLALRPRDTPCQLGHALWREHRGRLVEDEHPRAAPECLDDLDVLLLAQGQAAGPHVRVDVHAQRGRQLGEPRPGARLSSVRPRLRPEHQVLEHGERRDERECWYTMPMPELDRPAAASRSGPRGRRRWIVAARPGW